MYNINKKFNVNEFDFDIIHRNNNIKKNFIVILIMILSIGRITTVFS